MSLPEKVKRKYSKNDLQMLEQAQTMLENFIEDQAEFEARYPFFDAQYATDWQTAITNADNAPDDDEVMGDQKQKTFTLNDTMELAASKYSYLANFLKVIYRVNPQRVLDHFGMTRSRKSRVRQMRQKELMALAYERANSATYKPNLLAKGFTQAEIDELNTLAQQLGTDNKAQEKSKTDRPEMAQNRIILYNLVWDIMSEVHAGSLVVFADDYARQQHYLLYPEKSNSENILQVIESTIAPGSYKNEGALPAGAVKTRITAVSGGPIEFGLTQDGIVFNGNTFTLNAVAQTTYLITDFASAGNIIYVHNQSGVAQGEYKIEILG